MQEDQELNTGEDTTLNEYEDDQPQEELDPRTLQAQKNHWRSKAIDESTGKTYKELYEEATKPTPQPKSEEPKPDVTPKPTVDPEAIKSELREELRLEAQGYNDDEKEVIMKASKALGVLPTEAAKDDIVLGKISREAEGKHDRH